MKEAIREEFSFLNFLDDVPENYGFDDDSLQDLNLINCIRKLFQFSDDNGWLNSKQKLTSIVKTEFERIFNENFNKSEK